MNVFEAGVLVGLPAGAITGGVLLKSYGILAMLAGVAVGGIVGAFAGLLYAFLVIFVMAVVVVLWKAARGTLDDEASKPGGAQD